MNTVCSGPSIVDAADTTHRLEGYLSLYNPFFDIVQNIAVASVELGERNWRGAIRWVTRITERNV